jgi:hypothetical protein
MSNSSAASDYVSPYMTIQFCVEVCRGKGQAVAATQVFLLVHYFAHSG